MRNWEDATDNGSLAGTKFTIDFGLALIVAKSPVTRVVVSRIAQQVGLRTHSQTPEEAQPVITGTIPFIALLAGGADGRDCDKLLEKLVAIRRQSGSAMAPRLVMLMNKMTSQPHHSMIDATVMMPVTPDQLQPAIRDLMDRPRG